MWSQPELDLHNIAICYPHPSLRGKTCLGGRFRPADHLDLDAPCPSLLGAVLIKAFNVRESHRRTGAGT